MVKTAGLSWISNTCRHIDIAKWDISSRITLKWNRMKQGIWGILSLFLRKTFMKYAKKTEPKQGAANIKEICSPAKQSFSPFCLELLSLPNKNNTSVNNKQSSSFKRRKANKTKQNGHLNKQQQLISIVCNSLYMFSLLSLWQTT